MYGVGPQVGDIVIVIIQPDGLLEKIALMEDATKTVKYPTTL
jgi:hypothetical protein